MWLVGGRGFPLSQRSFFMFLLKVWNFNFFKKIEIFVKIGPYGGVEISKLYSYSYEQGTIYFQNFFLQKFAVLKNLVLNVNSNRIFNSKTAMHFWTGVAFCWSCVAKCTATPVNLFPDWTSFATRHCLTHRCFLVRHRPVSTDRAPLTSQHAPKAVSVYRARVLYIIDCCVNPYSNVLF